MIEHVGNPYWISRGNQPWAVTVRGRSQVSIGRFHEREDAEEFRVLVLDGVDPITAELRVKDARHRRNNGREG